MSSLKHNKKRDPALVYEFLVRRAAKKMVEGDRRGSRVALSIIGRHFSPGSPLAAERELSEAIRCSRGLTEHAARGVLKEVRVRALESDSKALDDANAALIRDVNRAIGRELFSAHKVPEYRLLASAQILIDSTRRRAMSASESVDMLRLEDSLVSHMTSTGQQEQARRMRTDVDSLVVRLAAKRFEEEHGRLLSSRQKRLVEEFMLSRMTGDSSRLASFITSERERMLAGLSRASTMDEFRSDASMASRLAEARDELASRSLSSCDDDVREMLLYQRLSEEIESDG